MLEMESEGIGCSIATQSSISSINLAKEKCSMDLLESTKHLSRKRVNESRSSTPGSRHGSSTLKPRSKGSRLNIPPPSCSEIVRLAQLQAQRAHVFLQQVIKGSVRVVHLAYRDRLCRFAYDLIECIFKHHNTEITVEAHDASSPEGELAEDVLSIITVFRARMYGQRSGAARGRFTG